MKGSELLLSCLRDNGVDTIFGYPGGSVIPFYDALYDNKHFKHIRTAHEQGASHAADGYARSTGKPGVLVATSGPGATNTVTGIATAYADSIPMIVITGQVTTDLLGRDSFQEVDITGMTFSITKHNFLVRDVNEIPSVVDKAFKMATTGRPGPVLIDIPKDIFTATVNDRAIIDGTYSEEASTIDLEKLDNIVEQINESKKPMIYVGGGVKKANASDILNKFVEKINSPVVSSVMGLGCVSRENPLSLGMVGMHGFLENNKAVSSCDLLIAIGARFSDRVIGDPNNFAKHAKIIHIDIDESETSKNIISTTTLIGDIKEILKEITDKVEEKSCEKWLSEINEYKGGININENEFHPINILKMFNEKFNKDTFVATDVGQHQMWTTQFLSLDSNKKLLTSGGLGAMGFGFPGAIGAQIACPKKQVICITGDGGFQMNMAEMATAVAWELPIVILVLNNSFLGMVRQQQQYFCEKHYYGTCLKERKSCHRASCTAPEQCPPYIPDFLKFAESYHVAGFRVTEESEIEQTLKEAAKTAQQNKAPVLVEFILERYDIVLPIVRHGGTLDNMILEQN